MGAACRCAEWEESTCDGAAQGGALMYEYDRVRSKAWLQMSCEAACCAKHSPVCGTSAARADCCRELTGAAGADCYRELTGTGLLLCAVLGLAAELLIYLCFGLSLTCAPLVVAAFLWLSLSIVGAGVLLALDSVLSVFSNKCFSFRHFPRILVRA